MKTSATLQLESNNIPSTCICVHQKNIHHDNISLVAKPTKPFNSIIKIESASKCFYPKRHVSKKKDTRRTVNNKWSNKTKVTLFKITKQGYDKFMY